MFVNVIFNHKTTSGGLAHYLALTGKPSVLYVERVESDSIKTESGS